MPYGLRYRIAQVYDEQRIYADEQQRFLDLFLSPQTYVSTNCWYAAYVLELTLADITASEQYLSGQYSDLLRLLPQR